jgi:multimeric flavodoxin WrbA
MKVLVVTASPNEDGLTAACGEAARQGVVDGQSRARVINLNSFRLDRCAVCGNGWGTCRTEHQCCLDDDFADLQGMFGEADAYVLVTPVYFGEPSESFKALADRLRRCEATKDEASPSVLSGKPALGIAAAGGSGGGAVHCLAEMERWMRQVGAAPLDFIPVTQRTRSYQLETIHDALVSMCTSEPAPRPMAAPAEPKRRGRAPRATSPGGRRRSGDGRGAREGGTGSR